MRSPAGTRAVSTSPTADSVQAGSPTIPAAAIREAAAVAVALVYHVVVGATSGAGLTVVVAGAGAGAEGLGAGAVGVEGFGDSDLGFAGFGLTVGAVGRGVWLVALGFEELEGLDDGRSEVFEVAGDLFAGASVLDVGGGFVGGVVVAGAEAVGGFDAVSSVS
jgi:hypothetical protein